MCAQNIEIMPGIVVDLNEGLESGDLVDGKTQEDAYEGKENAAVEGVESATPPATTPATTPEPEVKPEVKTEPPKVEEPSLQIFKIKYAGEDRELKLTQEQLINRLQKSEDYDTKIAKLAEDRREVEPFKQILETPKFKTFLEEGIADGSFSLPKVQPPLDEDKFELERRKMDPDFPQIQEAMRNWV